MTELLSTLRLIAELTQGAEQVARILSMGRELTSDEIRALRDRIDASTSQWLDELERLRNDRGK